MNNLKSHPQTLERTKQKNAEFEQLITDVTRATENFRAAVAKRNEEIKLKLEASPSTDENTMEQVDPLVESISVLKEEEKEKVDQLVLEFMPLAAKTTAMFIKNLPNTESLGSYSDDLHQISFEVLVRAVLEYDPSIDGEFEIFTTKKIKNALRDAAIKWGLVKKRGKERTVNIHYYNHGATDDSPSPESLAEEAILLRQTFLARFYELIPLILSDWPSRLVVLGMHDRLPTLIPEIYDESISCERGKKLSFNKINRSTPEKILWRESSAEYKDALKKLRLARFDKKEEEFDKKDKKEEEYVDRINELVEILDELDRINNALSAMSN